MKGEYKHRAILDDIIEEDGEKSTLSIQISERLGFISMSGYSNMPRKTKKAAKKVFLGNIPTQRELSRLQALRNRQNKPEA
jgi:hypothetical protein